jgi:DNA-binding response OmpR family regulator
MAFAAGCDAYIAKPVNLRSLLAQVREFLPGSEEDKT